MFQMFTKVFLFASKGLVVYVASFLYQDGKISIGEITSFLFYFLMLLLNFTITAHGFGSMVGILGSADDLVPLLNVKSSVNTQGGATIPDGEIDGTIEVKDVKFNYPSKNEVQVLKGVSIQVDQDKKRVVALCGTSGCGKSSIVAMLERFYDPIEGEVLFNGRNIKELDPRWYHKQIAIVQQEPVLFSGTIEENIIYGFDVSGLSQD